MFDSGGPSLLPVLAREISSALVSIGKPELAEQALRVVVPLQRLSGEESCFSFLAYPWPRLTYEERCAIELQEHEPIVLKLEGASIQIDLDDFGQINWLKISNASGWFRDLDQLMKANQE
ncbi:hypothetical protein ACFONG_19455 [Uliginosibacterium paludis]|uniref:Uncharacterized protein n=1 Tax=Uliginosibacterium paludis TaxID=1615952 RepID=A0ABV2CUE1_9RHOO